MTKADFCRNVLTVSSIGTDTYLVDILTDHPLVEKLTDHILTIRDTWDRVKVVINLEARDINTNKRIMSADDWVKTTRELLPIIPEEYWDPGYAERDLTWYTHLREQIYQKYFAGELPITKSYSNIKSALKVIDNAVDTFSLWYEITTDTTRHLSDDEMRWLEE